MHAFFFNSQWKYFSYLFTSQLDEKKFSISDQINCHRCRLAVPALEPTTLCEKLTICPTNGNVVDIINRLSVIDRIDLCKELHLCVPGVYPFIFNTKACPDIKKRVGANMPEKKILEYLQVKRQIIMPKHIIIEDSKMPDIYFGPEDLKPGSKMLRDNNLVCLEMEHTFILARKEFTSEPRDVHTANCVPPIPEHQSLHPTPDHPGPLSDPLGPQNDLPCSFDDVATTCDAPPYTLRDQPVTLPHPSDPGWNTREPNDNERACSENSAHNEPLDNSDSFNPPGSPPDQPPGPSGSGPPSDPSDDFLNDDAGQESEDPSNDLNGDPGGGPSEPDDDPSDIPTGNSSPDDSIDDHDSATTFGTSRTHVRKSSNLFMNPQKLSNEDFHALIHCSKQQFIEFVDSLQDNHFFQKSPLSKYSQAFLFRLKLASNWSFDELATCFVCSKRTARRIFWNLLEKYHQNNLAFPDLLQGNQPDIELFFQKLYDAEDTFYKEIFGSFKDPTGKLPFI